MIEDRQTVKRPDPGGEHAATLTAQASGGWWAAPAAAVLVVVCCAGPLVLGVLLANLLRVDRRRHLLLAHAGTLFPVFVADVRKADLLPLGQVVVDQIRRALDMENLAPDALGGLDPTSVRLAATASRSVLGYMNEAARFCEYAIADHGGLEGCDIDHLNRDIRRELHLSRRPPGYFVPIDLVIKRSPVRTDRI